MVSHPAIRAWIWVYEFCQEFFNIARSDPVFVKILSDIYIFGQGSPR